MNIFFVDDGIVLIIWTLTEKVTPHNKQKAEEEKRADDTIVLKKKKEEKGNKAEENCRKYATEMKNDKRPLWRKKNGELSELSELYDFFDVMFAYVKKYL